MKKLTIEQLKEGLLNAEISFMCLDNFMSNHGYYSVFDDGAIAEIKEDKNVVYTGVDSGECEIIISFEIEINNSHDETEFAFDIKVTGVEKF